MHRNTFLVIGVVGVGLFANGFLPIRADAPARNATNARTVQMPGAETQMQGDACGQEGEIALNATPPETHFKTDMAINTPTPRGSKITSGPSLLKKHYANTDTATAQFPARVEATIQHGIDNGSTSGIGETFFTEINTVVRWMSLIALSIFIFVVYKACSGPVTKPTNIRRGTADSPAPQIHGL